MQTILGSGGTIGIPLARELKKHTDHIRLVSRNPKKVNEDDELYSLDFTQLSGIEKAIEGSEIVYITVGFEYNLAVWQKIWPPFIKAVIEACEKQSCKLVFFDNMYMYDPSTLGFMTEEAPLNPCSKKGLVRKELVEMIQQANQRGLKTLIARAADFYGPECNNSLIGETIVKNLLKGKKAQALSPVDKIHTYSYTPDAAKATALLGNTEDVYGQSWHLPTTKEKLTQKEWIELVAKEIGVKAAIQNIPLWMLRLLGLFIKPMREFPEMLYQGESDYIFDSSKFEKRFGSMTTPPEEGVKQMVQWFKTQVSK